MYHYIWWIPITAVIAVSCAFASVQVNRNPSSWWFWYMWLPLTVWPFISRISKNIVFDGILYDFLVAVSWLVGFIIFGATKTFTPINYIGIGLAIIGLLLLKI